MTHFVGKHRGYIEFVNYDANGKDDRGMLVTPNPWSAVIDLELFDGVTYANVFCDRQGSNTFVFPDCMVSITNWFGHKATFMIEHADVRQIGKTEGLYLRCVQSPCWTGWSRQRGPGT